MCTYTLSLLRGLEDPDVEYFVTIHEPDSFLVYRSEVGIGYCECYRCILHLTGYRGNSVLELRATTESSDKPRPVQTIG